MIRNNLDMWADAAEHVRTECGTPEVLEKSVLEADMAVRFFACTGCGAPKGERCEADTELGPEQAWLTAFDTHTTRRNRWTGISDLEREMLKSVMDE